MDHGRRQKERDELLATLSQEIPRSRMPITYRLAMVFVTVAMVLLPLIYVSLVALLGYGVFWHATENTSIIFRDGNNQIKALLYLTPLFAGVIVLIFLLKPLIAKSPKTYPHFSLHREDQPYLFEFVDRLCDAIGSPRPQRIDVDTEANASAGLRRGFASFLSNDLVLTIGLPLVSGFSASQLAGVLAHEFGHFSQTGGMRFGYAIRRVNRWFSRVVYERDSWDERLDRWQRESESYATIIVGITRGCVWLSRKILWVLRQVGLILSSYLSRQMEYDADRFEAKLVGVDGFRGTTIQLERVSVAVHWARQDLKRSSGRGTLADDVPALVMDNLAQIEQRAEFDRKLRENAVGGTRQLLSTHPTPRDRIASVVKDGSPGVLFTDASAEILFDNYEELCRKVTTYHYSEEYELDLERFDLVPTASLTASINAQQARFQRVHRHFGGLYPAPRRVWTISGSDRESADRVRAELARQAETVLPQLQTLDEAMTQEVNLIATAAAFRCSPSKQQEVKEIEEALEEVREAISASEAALDDWVALGESSLFPVGSEESPSLHDECRSALRALEQIWPQRRIVLFELETLDRLFDEAEDELPNLKFGKQEAAQRLYTALSAIAPHLEGVPHPYRGDGFGETLLAELLPELESDGPIGDLIQSGRRLAERSGALSMTALAPFTAPLPSTPASSESSEES